MRRGVSCWHRCSTVNNYNLAIWPLGLTYFRLILKSSSAPNGKTLTQPSAADLILIVSANQTLFCLFVLSLLFGWLVRVFCCCCCCCCLWVFCLLLFLFCGFLLFFLSLFFLFFFFFFFSSSFFLLFFFFFLVCFVLFCLGFVLFVLHTSLVATKPHL